MTNDLDRMSADERSAALRVAMTGKASSAKPVNGDEPVFAYIASLPQPQRGIAERLDNLAMQAVPDLKPGGEVGWPITVEGRVGAFHPALLSVT